MFTKLKILLGFLLIINSAQQGCREAQPEQTTENASPSKTLESVTGGLKLGAERFDVYLPKLQGKRVAMVVNQTSMIGEDHVVDLLLGKDINVVKIFSPEHGFRGTADAGEKVSDGKDSETGILLVSLYGKKRKPAPEDLAGVDIVIFDIQDVGVRYYTFIGTMHHVMEACAENGKAFMVLDRPNPNGHYVDGNILDLEYRSFVGMHPVPIVHGMTVGEYAQMINGEGWLEGGIKCQLEVIPCKNYDHGYFYSLPVKPSPNLPNSRSIYLYPSICLFEGTVVSVGRGTNTQFQVLGHPDYPEKDFSFTPVPMPGAKSPKLEGKVCYGIDLSQMPLEKFRQSPKVDFQYLLDFYERLPDKDNFFLVSHFDRLAGTDQLRKQIIAGTTMEEIRRGWEEGLTRYKAMRKQYLLYP